MRSPCVLIQQTLRALPRAWVRAEVQKVSIGEKVSSIELVETDATGKVVAKARVKFWRPRWQEIERRFAELGLRIEAGTKILVHVQADLQPAFGFELDGHDIDPNYTLGDLATRLAAFREKLRQEGLFDRQGRLPASRDFQRVAVITPALSAGGADFERLTRSLHERGLVEIVTLQAVFQSAAASKSIRDACARSSSSADRDGTAPWPSSGAAGHRPIWPISPTTTWLGPSA